MTIINIDHSKSLPIYLQITDSIIEGINNKSLQSGDKLPSINEISVSYSIARETVNKSFKILQEKGVIKSIHGKGFYISSNSVVVKHKIFLMLGNYSAYMSDTVNGIKKTIKEKAEIDFYFHHFNPKQFELLIKNNLGLYTEFVVSSFDHPDVLKALKEIPSNKLYVIDILPENSNITSYKGVYQDHGDDIARILFTLKESIKRYNNLQFIFRDTFTLPPQSLKEKFIQFCQGHGIEYKVFTEYPKTISKGDSYIVIDDTDLVQLVTDIHSKGLKMGQDIGVISYNEIALKKVVSTGISTISTDFEYMGKQLATLILGNKRELMQNPTFFIDRGSF